MIESVGCTPLHSWMLLGTGILIGAAFGVILAGLLSGTKHPVPPLIFWCPTCKRTVKARYVEGA